MTLYNVKECLDRLKTDQKLDYEWVKPYAGSLVIKNSSKDIEEIIQLVRRDINDDVFNELSFNRFNPAEFGQTKFIIIHKEKIELTQEYSKFKSKFENEIKNEELTNRAEKWLAQFPFFDWKI